MVEVNHLREVFCLGLCDEIYGSDDLPREYQSTELEEYGERLMGLALAPVSECKAVFKGVGLIRWMRKSSLEGISLSDIEII